MTQQDFLNALMEQYCLVHLMAEKNECRVLRLRHKELGRDLVVRQLPHLAPTYEMLCDVLCPHLPQIYDVIHTEDGTTVLEEYVDGMTLTQTMESHRFRYSEARKVVKGICRALSVLHKGGFVHRDVKPDNVIVTPDGRAVLIDLNIARQVNNASRDTVIMGTVGYASPEQLGMSQSDARTDIYAMGVLLNVMLTGHHPSEQLAKGYAGRVVRKCTAVNPADRYQTADKLSQAL